MPWNPFNDNGAIPDDPEWNPFRDSGAKPDGPEQGYFADKARRLAREVPKVIGDVVASPGSAVQAGATAVRELGLKGLKAAGAIDDDQVEELRKRFEAEAAQSPLLQAAQATRDVGKQIADVGQQFQPDPRRDGEIGSAVASGAASLVPLLATGGTGIAGPALVNAGMMGEQQRQDAEEHGATDAQQAASFMIGAPVGLASEAVLGVPAMMRGMKGGAVLPKVLQGAEQGADRLIAQGLGKVLPAVVPAAQQFVKNAVREGIQEGLEQFAQNAIAKDAVGYDKERDYSEGAGMAALAGGIVGGHVGAAEKVLHQIDTAQNLRETKKTLQAQQQQLIDGRRPAQMFPVNAEGKVDNELALPEGMARLATDRGVFHYNPQLVDEETILKATGAARENDVLALGSQSKADVEARAAQGDPHVAVTERMPDGTEVKTAVATQGTANQTAAELEKSKTPGNVVAVEPIGRVPAERAASRNLVQDLLDREAKRSEEQRAAQDKERQNREAVQQALAEKRARFDERMTVASQALQPGATFPEVDGALRSVAFYADDNSIGLQPAQRQAAARMKAALEKRLAPLQQEEDARRALETEMRAKAQAAAEAKAKAERTAAKQDFKQQAAAGIGATGQFDYRQAPMTALEQRAEQGDAKAIDEIGRRSALEGVDEMRGDDLLTVLRRVKLPTSDAALGAELAQLTREEMTPTQRAQLTRTEGKNLDGTAEALREAGFASVQTPADVLDIVGRALRGEKIYAENTGERQVDFASGRPHDFVIRWVTSPSELDEAGLTDSKGAWVLCESGTRKPIIAISDNPDAPQNELLKAAAAGVSETMEIDMGKAKELVGFEAMTPPPAPSTPVLRVDALPRRAEPALPPPGLPERFARRMGMKLDDVFGTLREVALMNQSDVFEYSRGLPDDLARDVRGYWLSVNPTNADGTPASRVRTEEQIGAELMRELTRRYPQASAMDMQRTLVRFANYVDPNIGISDMGYDRDLAPLLREYSDAVHRRINALTGDYPSSARRNYGSTPVHDGVPVSTLPSRQDVQPTPPAPPVAPETRALYLRLAQLFKRVASRDSAWQLPRKPTTSKDINEVAKAYETPNRQLKVQDLHGGEYIIHTFDAAGKKIGEISFAVQRNGLVTVGASVAGSNKLEDGGGKYVYQTIFTWAHNNGYRVAGSSLSPVNRFRRTINMLSSALRHNTTDHLIPYVTQEITGWKPGDTDQNIGAMLVAASRMADRKAPALAALTYDLKTDTVTNQYDGRTIPDAELRGILDAAKLGENEGIGPATAKVLLLARSDMAANARGKGHAAEKAISRASRGSLQRILYARGAGADNGEGGRSAVADAGAEHAGNVRPTTAPRLSEAQVEQEARAIREAFPRLLAQNDVELANVQQALADRGYRGTVPASVQAAVMRAKGERTLIVLGVQAYRDRTKGAGLLTHEMAHPYWDMLPEPTKQALRELHRHEVDTKSGPLYANKKLQTELDFVEDDNEQGHKEWFAERIARLNETWAKGKMDLSEQNLLRRAAFQLREIIRKIWSQIARTEGIDPESRLFKEDFRRYFESGGDASIARRAGAEFAQSLMALDTPVGIDLPNEIRNLQPRWQDKVLQFESSLDKALYYAGGENSETRARVTSSLADQTGLSPGQIASLARDLRQKLAPLARSTSAEGVVRVPAQMRPDVAKMTGTDFATAAEQPDPIKRLESKLVDVRPGDRAAKARAEPWLDVMPAFQGGKYQMAEAAAKILRDNFQLGELAQIDTVEDYFGGGGMWGAYLALSHFKNAKRVIVHEFDPMRAAKIELFHTRGDQVKTLLKSPEVQELIATAVQMANSDETTLGTALAARIRKLVAGKSPDVVAIGGALNDAAMGARGRAVDAKGVKTAEATAAKILDIVVRDARQAREGIKALEARGTIVERRTGDSYANEPTGGDRTVAVMDPPYYLTTGYDGSEVGLNFYSRTAEMVRRMAAAGNAVVYTDSAWHIDRPDAAATDEPGRRLLGNIVDSLGAFGIVKPKGANRNELIGINRPGQSAAAAAIQPIDIVGDQEGNRRLRGERPEPQSGGNLFDGHPADEQVAGRPAAEGAENSSGDGSGRPEDGQEPAKPLTPDQRRYDALREKFEHLAAEADQIRAEMDPLWESDDPEAENKIRALRGTLQDNERATQRLYEELAQLRKQIDAANPHKPALPEGMTAEQVIAQAARAQSLPAIDRKAALLTEWRYGKKLRDQAMKVGNHAAEEEGQRLVNKAKARLDDEFPGWEKDAYAKTEKRTPPPLPAAEPEVAGLDDAEKSPFAEPPPEMPVRSGKLQEFYGHTNAKPTLLERSWNKVRDVVVGIRGAVPELPAFPAARWNQTDEFIKEHGPTFYDGIKAFYRKLTASNDHIQRTAEEQVADIARPLVEAGGLFKPNDYARLQALQEASRRAKADGRVLGTAQQTDLAALQSKLEASPYVLFNRLITLLDLTWRHQNLKDSQGNPIALPFGINEAELQAELARLGERIAASDHQQLIHTAVQKHEALVKQVAEDLKARDLMAVESLQNPWYFPHLTLEVTVGGKTKQRELRPTRVQPETSADFRGYLVDPVGSLKPIETDYVNAMYYHLVQVGAHNVKADAIRDHVRPYDLKSTIEARAKELSRERGVPVSWGQAFNEEYAPRGYVLYGTDSRDAFPSITIDREKLAQRMGVMLTSDDLHQQLKQLGLDGVQLLPEDIRESLQQGMRETWVLPARVAEALRGIAERQDRNPGAIDRALKTTVGMWKAWKLFMPWNHIRYEYGNVVADLEKLFSASPQTFKYFPQAAKEVRALWLGGKPGTDLRAAVREGVINTITAQEMKALTRLPNFRAFESWHEKLTAETKAALSAPLVNATRMFHRDGLLGRVTSVEESAYREAVFRYAKFLSDLHALRAGARPAYAGAYWKEIDGMQETRPGAGDANERKAAQISKSTFGDYGDLSVTGAAVRDKLAPFYSWIEVNFKYHANLLRNLSDMVRAHEMSQAEAAKAGARAAAVFAAGFTARAAGGMVLRLAFPYAVIALWNGTGDRDEMEKLLSEEDRRRFHIILGEATDGNTTLRDGRKVSVIYAQTALLDVMKWFGGPKLTQAAAGWLAGRQTFPEAFSAWRDTLVPDTINNTVGNFGPAVKIPYTLTSKKNPFPDVTDQRTVPAYDMRRIVLGQMTDEFTADQIEKVINKDYYGPKDLGNWAKQLIFQIRHRDPDSWAFYAIKDKAAQFMETRTGQKRDSAYDAPDQQVLRNFRRALFQGDAEKAAQFYVRLLDYGYTAERFAASIRAQDPLSSLPKDNGLRRQFVESLTADEREMLQRAYTYYGRINEDRGHERQLFPSARGGEAALERYRAAPRIDRLQAMMERQGSRTEDDELARADRALRESLRKGR